MNQSGRSDADEEYIQLLRSMTADELKAVHDGAKQIAIAVQTSPDRRTPEQVTLAMRHTVWCTVHKLPMSKESLHEKFVSQLVRPLALPTEGTKNGN
jgi:hypothetical protein